jgi:hypothetical protein
MTPRKEDRKDLIQRHLKDLDELERETRRWFKTEPWLMDEINKRRFQLVSELNRMKNG